MKIRVINPNTSEQMTREIGEAALKCARADTEISTVCPQFGPESIESAYDKYMAVPGLLQEVNKAVKDDCDGIVVACFGDPALDAARELADIPVIGICEASVFMAGILGRRFSVLTVLGGAESPLREQIERYGLGKRCASIRAKDVGVLNFAENKEQEMPGLIDLSEKIVEEDRAEAIILGCAGMSGVDSEMEKALGIPVIDPVVAAVKLLEAIIDSGKKTGKEHPHRLLHKEVKGYPEYMQPFPLG